MRDGKPFLRDAVASSHHERRKHYRLHFELSVELLEDHRRHHARTVDISEGGVFVATGAPIKVGSEIRMGLRLESSHIVVIGRVAWQRVSPEGRHEGVGIEFHSLSPHARWVLRNFIARRRAQEFAAAARRDAPRPNASPSAV